MILPPNKPFRAVKSPNQQAVVQFADRLESMPLQKEQGGRFRGTACSTVCGTYGHIIPSAGVETEQGVVLPYYLPGALNQDFNGTIRFYNCLNTLKDGTSFWSTDFIKWLTEYQLNEHPVKAPYYHYEIMVIRYVVTRDNAALVTPNELHFDRLGNKTRSCVFTIERTNVKGGTFAIARGTEVGLHISHADPSAMLYNNEIPVGEGIIFDERPWDGGHPICHSATETHVDDASFPGYRTIIATEMTPIFPIIH